MNRIYKSPEGERLVRERYLRVSQTLAAWPINRSAYRRVKEKHSDCLRC